MLEQLRGLEEFKFVGEVRGRGLALAVEFVKDKETKEPFQDIVAKVQMECFKRGLLIWRTGYSSIRFLPPLIITEELADKGVEIFINAVKRVEGYSAR
jgi:4-aminobutyrate aminotransferase-like enzyme